MSSEPPSPPAPESVTKDVLPPRAEHALFEFLELTDPPPVPPQQPPQPPPPPTAPLPDPWAHRRGEPRLFAFFWTFYILLSVAGSLTWLARAGVITPGSYGPAARIMLVVIAVGMTVLWPMTRLSQASPAGNSIGATLADLFVVQLPVQIVIWPLYVLANWPRDIIIAIAVLMLSWGVLTGGLLAWALGGRGIKLARDPRLGGRAAWMVMFVGLMLAAPVMLAVYDSRAAAAPGWVVMASPLTAIPALTGRGLVGPGSPVSQPQWDVIVSTFSLGVFSWALAVARNGLNRQSRQADPGPEPPPGRAASEPPTYPTPNNT